MSLFTRAAGFVFIALALAASISAQGPAAKPHKNLMAVVSKGLPGIVLFDADTDEEICRQTTKPAPHTRISKTAALRLRRVHSAAAVHREADAGEEVVVEERQHRQRDVPRAPLALHECAADRVGLLLLGQFRW